MGTPVQYEDLHRRPAKTGFRCKVTHYRSLQSFDFLRQFLEHLLKLVYRAKEAERCYFAPDHGSWMAQVQRLASAISCPICSIRLRICEEHMPLSPSIRLIKDMVNRLDPSISGMEEDPAYRTAVVLLAALRIGPRVNDLATLTGYESKFVGDIFARMRLAGLWSETEVRSDHWLAEDGDTIQPAVFWADALVAQGLAMAQPEGPIRVRYWALERDTNRNEVPSGGVQFLETRLNDQRRTGRGRCARSWDH